MVGKKFLDYTSLDQWGQTLMYPHEIKQREEMVGWAVKPSNSMLSPVAGLYSPAYDYGQF